MLLTIDIGNTSTSIGIFDSERLVANWSISTDKHRSIDEIGILLVNLLNLHDFKGKVQNAALCSVVLPLTDRFKKALSEYLKITPFIVSNKTVTSIKYDYDNPDEIGPDRIVNAFAAYSKYKKACIVVDFGTATSFDIVSAKGEFSGGIICAGMNIQAESLKKFTSKLPLIKIESSKTIIGKNTIDAMLSGIVRGHAKMVEGLINECQKEQELGNDVVVIATGGYAEIISQYMERKFDYINPFLTLEGLKLIYESQDSKEKSCRYK